MHPSIYGEIPSPVFEPYDHVRDAASLALIRAAIGQGVPLLAICRGMQELNVALGGTLHPEIHALPGRIDHRAPEVEDEAGRFALCHRVTLEPGRQFARLLGGNEIEMNSLHRQGAASFAVGVQWHPEYFVASDPPSQKLFAAFGQAARLRRASQGQVT